MTAQQLAITFPTCVLPGCSSPVDLDGDACRGCTDAFGTWLRRVADEPPLTAAEQAARDERAREIIRARRTLAIAREPREPQRRGSQLCWLCCERRMCTWAPSGWECDTCREIR